MIRYLPIALVVATASPARADDIAAGAIVKIDHQEIYVNLGRARVPGLADGAPLRLKRAITLRHPVSRRPITDWIPLGAATVTQAGDQLSRAVVGELVGSLAVGDLAEVYVEAAPEPEPAPAPEPTPGPAVVEREPAVDPATREILGVFARQSGAGLDARIAAWEGYLSAHPGTQFAPAIAADLEQLRALRATLSPDAGDLRTVATVALDHHAPTIARPGAPVPLVFVVGGAPVASAWLHYRTAGTRTFHRTPLRREQELYLRGAIPATAVHGSAVEYFVEVIADDGSSGVAQGTPQRPTRFGVEADTLTDQFTHRRDRTEVMMSAVYLDFANLDRRDGDRTDRELYAEAGVRYRLDGRIRAIGAGYGVFAGEGGADARYTPAAPPPETGFNYGYAEVEVGGGSATPVSIAGRLYAGVGKTGFELGVEGRVRIGAEDGTNLTATLRDVARIGFLSDLRLETRPHRKVPIGVAVGVLDQPAGNELAVRLGVDVGYAFGPVIPVARVSWQGRSIDHAGVGGGLAVAVRW